MILQTVVPTLVAIDPVLPPPGPTAHPVIGFMLGQSCCSHRPSYW